MRLPRTGAVQKNPKESMGTKTVFALPRAVKAASGALAFAPPSLPRRLSAYFSAQSFPHQDMRAALLVEGSPARRIAAARVKIGGTHLGVQGAVRSAALFDLSFGGGKERFASAFAAPVF